MSYKKFVRPAGLAKHRSKHYNAQEIIFAAAPILFVLPISEAKTTKINKLEILGRKDFSVSNYYFINLYLGILRNFTTFFKLINTMYKTKQEIYLVY